MDEVVVVSTGTPDTGDHGVTELEVDVEDGSLDSGSLTQIVGLEVCAETTLPGIGNVDKVRVSTPWAAALGAVRTGAIFGDGQTSGILADTVSLELLSDVGESGGASLDVAVVGVELEKGVRAEKGGGSVGAGEVDLEFLQALELREGLGDAELLGTLDPVDDIGFLGEDDVVEGGDVSIEIMDVVDLGLVDGSVGGVEPEIMLIETEGSSVGVVIEQEVGLDVGDVGGSHATGLEVSLDADFPETGEGLGGALGGSAEPF